MLPHIPSTCSLVPFMANTHETRDSLRVHHPAKIQKRSSYILNRGVSFIRSSSAILLEMINSVSNLGQHLHGVMLGRRYSSGKMFEVVLTAMAKGGWQNSNKKNLVFDSMSRKFLENHFRDDLPRYWMPSQTSWVLKTRSPRRESKAIYTTMWQMLFNRWVSHVCCDAFVVWMRGLAHEIDREWSFESISPHTCTMK